MKLTKQLAIGAVMMASAIAANAAVIASVNLGGGDPYWDDYDVVFGLGSTSAPTWQQQVAWAYNSGDGFGGSASIDITAQWNPSVEQDWWVFVDDNWGANDSYLTGFSINTGTAVYSATGLPIFIADHASAYSHIVTEATEVPEPGTLALGTAALLGLGLLRRKPKGIK